MAKEGSVAPKERINIVYKPATGDAKEEIELPLKLMMVGDYTLQADDRAVEDRAPVSVTKDNFNDVMESQKLSMDVNVKNKLAEGAEDEDLAVHLDFKNLKDFEPESIVRQVPELRQLLELREALTALKGPLGNIPAFRKTIQTALKDDGARKRLLDELNVGGGGDNG
ncbi:MAG: type VI secretion system contractile sheath small subunit [Pseudomonadota bacterium]